MKIIRGITRAFFAFLLLKYFFLVVPIASAEDVYYLYHVRFDDLLAENQQQKIISVFEQRTTENPIALCQQLKEQFPVIKQVTISYKPTGVYDVHLSSVAPRLCIDDATVFTEHGLFVSRASYNASYVDQFLNITLQESNSHDDQQGLLAFSELITPDLYTKFDIVWHYANSILLKDKANTQFQIACTCAQLPDSATIERCRSIYDMVVLEQPKKMKGNSLVTDIRFDQQIVAYLKKEGV